MLNVVATTGLNSSDDRALKTMKVFDGLGRVTETRTYEDSYNYIATQTQYDGLGRIWRVTNPFRPSEAPVWTQTLYDALDRPVEAKNLSDSSAVTTQYNLNRMTTTDAQFKQRQLFSDALGRLTSVTEDPFGLNYTTSYGYNALDALLTVTQGAQTRQFGYDGLGRLLSATNPEYKGLTAGGGYTTGATSYAYDKNGNVTEIRDPKGQLICYGTIAVPSGVCDDAGYDALNRPVLKVCVRRTPDDGGGRVC